MQKKHTKETAVVKMAKTIGFAFEEGLSWMDTYYEKRALYGLKLVVFNYHRL